MSRRLLVIVALVGTLAKGLVEWQIEDIYGLQNPTVPTRTPTPGAPPPTSPPSTIVPPRTSRPGGGGGPSPIPSTETPTPQASPTPFPPSATPPPNVLATAESCSDQPTVQALFVSNVRTGPGTDYETITTLAVWEVHPIIGRAQYANWWLVELSGSESGWIFDELVRVSGDTADVEIIPAPSLSSGETPTPGALWNPTPYPSCTLTPSPTETPTAKATPTSTPSPTSEPTATSDVTGSEEDELDESDVHTVASTTTSTPGHTPTTDPFTATPSPTDSSSDSSVVAVDASDIEGVTPTPIQTESPSGSVDFLLVGGALLFIAGLVLTVVRRRNPD